METAILHAVLLHCRVQNLLGEVHSSAANSSLLSMPVWCMHSPLHSFHHRAGLPRPSTRPQNTPSSNELPQDQSASRTCILFCNPGATFACAVPQSKRLCWSQLVIASDASNTVQQLKEALTVSAWTSFQPIFATFCTSHRCRVYQMNLGSSAGSSLIHGTFFSHALARFSSSRLPVDGMLHVS